MDTEELSRWRKIASVLFVKPRVEPSEAFVQRVMEAIEKEETVKLPLSFWRWPALAGVFALLAVMIWTRPWQREKPVFETAASMEEDFLAVENEEIGFETMVEEHFL